MTITMSKVQWRGLEDVFQPGNLEVWYMTPAQWNARKKDSRFGIDGLMPNPQDMRASHVLLGSVAGVKCIDDLDPLWIALQGENWSPQDEARTMLRSKGLQHTSMSVGDCFRFIDCDEVWMVAASGFKQVP